VPSSLFFLEFTMNIDIRTLQQEYARSAFLPSERMARILAYIEQSGRPEIWITRVAHEEVMARARELDRMIRQKGEAILAELPLFGIPFAVKDNIDVAGMPTTAACPEFAYTPTASATVVDKLLAAGAILIGKTNLDQFATGLVGTRSPYGAVRNAIDPAFASGGSSSGSAVAVALGMVAFALGTDTAGSGRVPAGLNGIVGLKPTRGLISTRGVVPACRTLDCVSVFAQTVGDAWSVLEVAAGHDEKDAYSRRVPMLGVKQRRVRIALPAQLEFCGDEAAEQAFRSAVAALQAVPWCEIGTVDLTPFRDAAQLLYQGPWVAERLAAVGAFFADHRAAMDSTVGGIIAQGANYSAVDTFNGQYRLAELRRQAEQELNGFDLLIVPTTPTMHTIAAVQQEPVKRNSEMGIYTNFVNFFDMAALSIPAQERSDGLPAGVTLIAPCGADQRLAALAERLLPHLQPTVQQAAAGIAGRPLPMVEPTVQLAVVGAHLDGQALNWQLLERGARKIAATRTARHYRLYALKEAAPAKPGLVRVKENGVAINVELWELPLRLFGEFVAEVPPPLAIGSLEMDDGAWVKGFVCEPAAIADAEDISAYGGWRAYLGQTSPKAA
jgi:allophanate hydrolase